MKKVTAGDPNSISYKVRQEIRNLRLKLGYTQEDLASKVGTKYQVILQYEKGTRGLSIKRLYVIAEALFTNPNYGLERSEKRLESG